MSRGAGQSEGLLYGPRPQTIDRPVEHLFSVDPRKVAEQILERWPHLQLPFRQDGFVQICRGPTGVCKTSSGEMTYNVAINLTVNEPRRFEAFATTKYPTGEMINEPLKQCETLDEVLAHANELFDMWRLAGRSLREPSWKRYDHRAVIDYLNEPRIGRV